MQKSTKAALLSALIFPGAGHMYLKKYVRGILLFAVSSLALYSLIAKTVESALQIVDKIQSSYVEPDVAALIELVAKQLTDTGHGVMSLDFALAIFTLCWLIGIIDSYRVGSVLEKNGLKIHLNGTAKEPRYRLGR